MIRIIAATFHRSHNHGSVLQAYALQRFVTRLFEEEYGDTCSYQIIDYHPNIQKQLYAVFQSGHSIKIGIKNLMALRYVKSLNIRHKRFNSFVEEYLSMTQEYKSADDVMLNPPLGDCYIAGSDQIWNVRAKDFSPIYYLNYVPEDALKISFSASFGPLPIDWSKYGKERYSALLDSFDKISVRETGSADNVEMLTGRIPTILADPTFLLDKTEWEELENKDVLEKDEFILLYSLEPTPRQLQLANLVSKKLHLPIVVLRYNNKNDFINPYKKRYSAGPREFLAYIAKAKMVLTSSFHGTAFSILYQKPFYTLDVDGDARISSVLEKTGLSDRMISSPDDINRVNMESPDFNVASKYIAKNRWRSVSFLKESFGLLQSPVDRQHHGFNQI